MRMSYNPILEDLLEAKEREEENLKEATRFRQEIKDTLQTMEDEANSRNRRHRTHWGDNSADNRKVSIMQSSLSREQLDSLENKLRVDFKGPNYYYPKAMFGKRVGQSITIPKDSRKLEPIPRM